MEMIQPARMSAAMRGSIVVLGPQAMAELRPLAEQARRREVGRSGKNSDPERRRGEATTTSAKTDPAAGELDDFDATIVPLPARGAPDRRTPHPRYPHRAEMPPGDLDASEGAVPIARITPRQQAKVAGRVRSIQVQRWSRIPTLELTIIDTAGDTLVVVFLGRRQIAGIQPGTDVSVEAMVASRSGRLSMLNPIYEILPDGPTAA
jgi:hypothetical protein